ncbi:DUF4419 domain-containing protein [Kitasatospora sp. NBC_00085]|uniref:DUF4419 domain-containing protein n=1 Tax=unclassified Kitasatospora TaxID=2633591 RepID=UPI00324837AB
MPFHLELPLDHAPEADRRAGELAAELTELGNERFLRAVLRDHARFHHRSTDRLTGKPTDAPEVTEPTSSLLLRAVHLAFAAHLPLSLAPDLLWYCVVHEVAVHVRLNQGAYAGLFTDSPGYEQTILVVDDNSPLDWERSINLVREPLGDRIGAGTADLFQPVFSTTTPADATATLVALMDIVSPYYRFRWQTLCGIPRIRLEGTAEDWQLLADRVRELAERFAGLRDWFTALHPVLDEIAGTAAGCGVDQEFWRSLYKHRSFSGGDEVTGWINAFFAHDYHDEGPRPRASFGPGAAPTDLFPSHVSRVPFRWETPAGTLDMAFLGGALGIERDGEWLRPRLGHAVVELLPSAEPADLLLPEPWTLADVQRCAGAREARLITELGTVTVGGEPAQAEYAIDLGWYCVVRSTDGTWYVGELRSDDGDITCWSANPHPDLGTALRVL